MICDLLLLWLIRVGRRVFCCMRGGRFLRRQVWGLSPRFQLGVVRGLRLGRRGVSWARSCRRDSRSEYKLARISLALVCARFCRHCSNVGRSCLAPGEDAVDGLEWVSLLSGLAGHEPTFVGLWSAVLAGAGVVCVDPAAIADYVAAIALSFAAVGV